MKKPVRILQVLTMAGALFGLSTVTATAAFAKAGPGSGAFTCASGLITSGTYQSLTVTGFCQVPDGASVIIKHGLVVAPNAALKATSCTATIIVGGGVEVDSGAILGLGGSVIGSGCIGANSTTIVHGGLRANGAADVILHGNTIDGGVSIQGGGGGFNCDPSPLGFPSYNAIEDSQINGGVTESGVSTCWIGFNRDNVNGGASFQNNQIADFFSFGDTMEITSNLIHGGLACSGNFTAPSDFNSDHNAEEPNQVTGQTTDQCAAPSF